MRSREVTSGPSSTGSTSDQCRSGATGARALQCGSRSAARASESVGYGRRGSPLAAAHRAGVVGSSWTAAARTRTSRSNGVSPNEAQIVSSAPGPGRDGGRGSDGRRPAVGAPACAKAPACAGVPACASRRVSTSSTATASARWLASLIARSPVPWLMGPPMRRSWLRLPGPHRAALWCVPLRSYRQAGQVDYRAGEDAALVLLQTALRAVDLDPDQVPGRDHSRDRDPYGTRVGPAGQRVRRVELVPVCRTTGRYAQLVEQQPDPGPVADRYVEVHLYRRPARVERRLGDPGLADERHRVGLQYPYQRCGRVGLYVLSDSQ